MKPFLFSNARLKEFKEYAGEKWNESRRSGRSTAKAFETIANSMNNPKKPQIIQDHCRTRESHEHLSRLIYNIIETFKLDGFVFNKARGTITFFLTEEDYKDSI